LAVFGPNRSFTSNFKLVHQRLAGAAMVQEAPIKIYARGVVSYFLFFLRAARALKISQIYSAILKVPDGALSC
jgi:hypothetical protein